MAAPAAKPDPHGDVTVTVWLNNENTGESESKELDIAGGPTDVPELKDALGIDPASALWVIQKNGKKKQLADHQQHNVKEGDQYEGIVRGGVS